MGTVFLLRGGHVWQCLLSPHPSNPPKGSSREPVDQYRSHSSCSPGEPTTPTKHPLLFHETRHRRREGEKIWVKERDAFGGGGCPETQRLENEGLRVRAPGARRGNSTKCTCMQAFYLCRPVLTVQRNFPSPSDAFKTKTFQTLLFTSYFLSPTCVWKINILLLWEMPRCAWIL